MRKLSISLSSQTGLVRDHNEDMVLVCTETYRDTEAERQLSIDVTDSVVIAVADGMGGHNAGEVASEDVATELGSHIAALPRVLDEDELRDNLDEWISDEHAYLVCQGAENAQQAGMGTTLVGVICYHEHFYAINCGDSRLYLFHDGKLTQLSNDHSLYNLTHRESDRHIVTNCIGAGNEAYLDFFDITEEIAQGDKLILCSDGLTDMVSDTELQALLTQNATAPDLVKAAYDAGGEDNVSVIVITIEH